MTATGTDCDTNLIRKDAIGQKQSRKKYSIRPTRFECSSGLFAEPSAEPVIVDFVRCLAACIASCIAGSLAPATRYPIEKQRLSPEKMGVSVMILEVGFFRAFVLAATRSGKLQILGTALRARVRGSQSKPSVIKGQSESFCF